MKEESIDFLNCKKTEWKIIPIYILLGIKPVIDKTISVIVIKMYDYEIRNKNGGITRAVEHFFKL